MRYRFPKTWCSACKTMQYSGECGHPYLEAPTVHPEAIGWARTQGDLAGLLRQAVDEAMDALTKARHAGFRAPVLAVVEPIVEAQFLGDNLGVPGPKSP